MEINPILHRYIRSELRLSKFLPLLIFVLILYVLTVLLYFKVFVPFERTAINSTIESTVSKEAEWQVLPLKIVLLIQLSLFLAGGIKIFSSLWKITSSGILDFHRISPMSGYQVALGFLFGIPLRQIILVLLGIPFVTFYMLQITVPERWGIVIENKIPFETIYMLQIPGGSLSKVFINYLYIFAIFFCLYTIILSTTLISKNSFWSGVGLFEIFAWTLLITLEFINFKIKYDFFLIDDQFHLGRSPVKLFNLSIENIPAILLTQYLPVFLFSYYSAARILDKSFNTALGRKVSFLLYLYILIFALGCNYDYDRISAWDYLILSLSAVIIVVLLINIPTKLRLIRGYVKEKNHQLSIWSDYSPSSVYFYLIIGCHFLFLLLITPLYKPSIQHIAVLQIVLQISLFCLITYHLRRFCKLKYEPAKDSVYFAIYSFIYFFVPLIIASLLTLRGASKTYLQSIIFKLSPFTLFEFGRGRSVVVIHLIGFLALYLVTKKEEAKVKKSLTVSNKT